MPTWDKEKAHAYYIKERERLRIMKRRQYVQQRQEKIKEMLKNEDVLNSGEGSVATDDKRTK